MLILFLIYAWFDFVKQHKSVSFVLIDYFAYLISIFIDHVTADLIDQIVFIALSLFFPHLFIVHH